MRGASYFGEIGGYKTYAQHSTFLSQKKKKNICSKEKYPKLFNLSLNKEVIVGDFHNSNSWQLQFRRALDPVESNDLLELRPNWRGI